MLVAPAPPGGSGGAARRGSARSREPGIEELLLVEAAQYRGRHGIEGATRLGIGDLAQHDFPIRRDERGFVKRAHCRTA